MANTNVRVNLVQNNSSSSSTRSAPSKPLPTRPVKMPPRVPTQARAPAQVVHSSAPESGSCRTPAILFVGSTGAGKSTLCNYLHDLGESEHLFITAQPGQHSSVTQDVLQQIVVVKNSANHNGSKFMLIDTPGLNESVQRDLDHMLGLFQALQTMHGISAIVLVIPYNWKNDVQWLGTVRYFRDAFMPLFTKGHACVVVTHMAEDDFEKAEEKGGFETIAKRNLENVNNSLGANFALFCLFVFLRFFRFNGLGV